MWQGCPGLKLNHLFSQIPEGIMHLFPLLLFFLSCCLSQQDTFVQAECIPEVCLAYATASNTLPPTVSKLRNLRSEVLKYLTNAAHTGAGRSCVGGQVWCCALPPLDCQRALQQHVGPAATFVSWMRCCMNPAGELLYYFHAGLIGSQ